MKNKIRVSIIEFDELKRLSKIVNNTQNPVSLRRICRAEYENILKIANSRVSP